MSVKVIERLVALPSVSRAVVEDDVLAAKPSPEVSGPCTWGSTYRITFFKNIVLKLI
jgi:hypothetical protein